MSHKDLILLGGGGHCKSVIDVAESTGYTILGILDKPELVGNNVLGYKVIGTDDDIPKYIDKAEFVITVGQIKSPVIRQKLASLVVLAGGKFATIIANDAHVSKYAEIGEGTVIMHKAVVNAGAKIGCNCIVNTMVNIEHDCEIGDFCHISTGTMVNGNVQIGNNVFCGSNSVVVNGCIIGDDIVIGANSLILESIFHKGIYVGNPVTMIRNMCSITKTQVSSVRGGG